jgi:predicted component of type VI protein secretion system
MSSKRNLTPVVPAPAQTAHPATPPRRHELKAPVLVVAVGKEWEFELGSLTIGRDTEANVSLTDPLVSRMHGRLVTQPDGQVAVEDLKSANGIFVNGTKLTRPLMPLCEGDRLLFGTTEISVFSLRASATVLAGPRSAKSQARSGDTLPSPSAQAPMPQVPVARRKREVVTTARSAPIDMIGEFARQLMESGHPLEALRTLSDPLQNLLKGASAGLSVPAPILESAARYALALRDWTQRDSWADYVLELHLACRQVPSETTSDLLEAAAKRGARIDHTLAKFLVATIDGRSPPATPEELPRLRRIEQLGC